MAPTTNFSQMMCVVKQVIIAMVNRYVTESPKIVTDQLSLCLIVVVLDGHLRESYLKATESEVQAAERLPPIAH